MGQESKQLFRKPTKTISGVAPVSVMMPPRRCEHGACLYCPTLNAPQSYTPESPAVLRARKAEYDPYRQVKMRIETLEGMGHPTDKIELILMGGTFLSYPEDFQFEFVKRCYDALNGVDSKTLAEAKKINETAKYRCTALCIETRPDVCSAHHIKNLLAWGTTRVELGVQILDDEIYKKINRCHDVAAVVSATKRLKVAGFKVGYHLMPGLPTSTPRHDIKKIKKVFSSQDFKPDQIKIYPCQVLKGSGLVAKYYNKEFVPYSKDVAKEIILKAIRLTPNYVRIMRIMREIPPQYLIAGITNLDLRHEVEKEIREQKVRVKEIRFREIGFALQHRKNYKIKTDLTLQVTKYKASDGFEFFIEAVNKDNILFGLLRLRLEKDTKIPAMVRELHVYGPALKLGEAANEEWQHKGLGKVLMQEAEKIAMKKGHSKMRVISGVGVREYYYRLGYCLDSDGIYVEKMLEA